MPITGLEQATKIPRDHQHNICLMGHGRKSCKFVTLCPYKGIVCTKGTPAGAELLRRENPLNILSNNCEGLNTKWEKK